LSFFIGQLPPLLNKQSRKQFHKFSAKTIFFLQKGLDNPVFLSQSYSCNVTVKDKTHPGKISCRGFFLSPSESKTGKRLLHRPKSARTAKHFSKAYNNTP
jgi:hypothetical protein